MASVFLYHVVGDLTVGKPELVEFHDTETVESAMRAIGECAEGAIAVWKKKKQSLEESKAARFVGMLNSLDVVAFIARAGDHGAAMRTPVSEVVLPNSSLLKEVDPGTRLIDALEMMKQGVRRLLVRKSIGWRGMSKRFSIIYNGKWLNNTETSISNPTGNSNRPLSSFHEDKYCCLSRENVIRFLIGCLGALAPLPLSSISALGAINPHYSHVESSSPALETVQNLPHDPCAIAVIETNPDGSYKIIGEISAYKLWKGDYLAAAWAMANLSAGQLVMGAEDNNSASSYLLDFSVGVNSVGASPRPRKFSSRSIGFFNNPVNPVPAGGLRGMYRGRSAPLMCKNTSSLAAVMAQMLSHRASHVWVTEAESNNEVLVGVVSYTEILHAVTRNPNNVVPLNP